MHAFVVIRMIHRGMEVINYNYLSYCNKVDFFVYNDDYVKGMTQTATAKA